MLNIGPWPNSKYPIQFLDTHSQDVSIEYLPACKNTTTWTRYFQRTRCLSLSLTYIIHVSHQVHHPSIYEKMSCSSADFDIHFALKAIGISSVLLLSVIQ